MTKRNEPQPINAGEHVKQTFGNTIELQGVALKGTIAKTLGLEFLLIGDSSNHVIYSEEEDEVGMTEEFLDLFMSKTENASKKTLQSIVAELFIEQSKYQNKDKKTVQTRKMIEWIVTLVNGVLSKRNNGEDLIGRYNQMKSDNPHAFKKGHIISNKEKARDKIDCQDIEIVINDQKDRINVLDGKVMVSENFILEFQEKIKEIDEVEINEIIDLIIEELPCLHEEAKLCSKALIKLIKTELLSREGRQ